MLIGLTGVQRTGKTTLAVEFCNQYQANYVDASISTYIAQLGYASSDLTYGYSKRVEIQEHLYTSLYNLFSTLPQNQVHVTDRTFHDLIFYALSSITEDTSDDHIEWLDHYIEKCRTAQAELFKEVVYIQPGIPVNNTKATSAKANQMIQAKGHLLFLGIFSEDPYYRPLPMFTTDLVNRIHQLNLIICGAHNNA